MTLGEHLDELRGCVMRGVIALALACLPCIWLAKHLLVVIARPLVLATRRHDQPTTFLTTGPAETFLVYLKVVVISGFIIAAPYVLYQLWTFVAAGLYPKEKDWVRRLAPLSVGLFLGGVAFMYVLVLPLALNYLVGFSSWLTLPDIQPTGVERVLLGDRGAAPVPEPPASQPALPLEVRADDPPEPRTGEVWFNTREQRIKIRGPDATYWIEAHRGLNRAMLTAHFRIGEYLTFVMIMTVAFGAAFQMPLVVVFLARSGLVPVETLKRYRRIVILVIVIIAGLIAPPDLISHLLLSLPMYVLFELGLLLARGRSAGGGRSPDAPAAR